MIKIIVNNEEISINGVQASLPKDTEIAGCRPKFWIRNSEGFDYLVKKPRSKDTLEHVGEVIFSNLFQNLDISQVVYSLAELHKENDSPSITCFCRSYKIKDSLSEEEKSKAINTSENEISGALLQEAHTKRLRTSKKIFTIDEYKKILDDMYPDSKGFKGKEATITHLEKTTILDYLTLQPDRHASNISFFVDTTPGKGRICPVPVFDSGNIFGLSYGNKTRKDLMKETDELRQQGLHVKQMGKYSKSPVLGISTPYSENDEDGLEKFEEELAERILSNEELKKFYFQAKQVNVASAFTPDVKKALGNQADDIENFASTVYNARIERLDSIIKAKLAARFAGTLKQKAESMQKESAPTMQLSNGIEQV